MGNEVNALSIIETVDIDNISTTMNKIAQMQLVVQKTLKEGHDFGEVPGTAGILPSPLSWTAFLFSAPALLSGRPSSGISDNPVPISWDPPRSYYKY